MLSIPASGEYQVPEKNYNTDFFNATPGYPGIQGGSTYGNTVRKIT